ncbi:MAG TPA: B12-binding domain-containing radical SAM protein [Acidisarcina sp.]
MVTRSSPNVLMVYPRFNPHSFWSHEPLCKLLGARCTEPPLGLLTVAALLPAEWNIRLVNCNAEELTDDDLAWSDMVMTGGMLFQQNDTLAITARAHAHRKLVVIGGPDVTSSPDSYRSADFLVLGEAEGIIEKFVEAWRDGATQGVFEGVRFQVDVTKTPVPRFDLIDLSHYLAMTVQFSRGCPFQCEFCDIIELYGRVPRAKANEQILNELDALYFLGWRGPVDFIDDNFIGNKKAVKKFLPLLSEWQRKRGYPFRFQTEASVNLSDDAELLKMMREANFQAVFIGIESPDPETLVSAQKRQNTRRSLTDSIHRVYEAGIYVVAGFIIGFDTEKNRVAETMIVAIEAMSIPVCMVGLLFALQDTQLSRRLRKEGRMLPVEANKGDQCTGGLNFVTLRPKQEILTDYRTVVQHVFAPETYFGRVRTMGRALRPSEHAGKRSIVEIRRESRAIFRLAWCMTFTRPALRRHFWKTVIDCAVHNHASLVPVLTMIAYYLHLGEFAKLVLKEVDGQIETLARESVHSSNDPAVSPPGMDSFPASALVNIEGLSILQ